LAQNTKMVFFLRHRCPNMGMITTENVIRSFVILVSIYYCYPQGKGDVFFLVFSCFSFLVKYLLIVFSFQLQILKYICFTFEQIKHQIPLIVLSATCGTGYTNGLLRIGTWQKLLWQHWGSGWLGGRKDKLL
jgi:hypothetical protein